MKYIEEQGDLFALSSEEWAFAQCISADFAMRAGIAVLFNKHYDTKNRLTEYLNGNFINFWNSDDAAKGWCIYDNCVYNLITKKNHWDKPTLPHIQKSLQKMKDMCILRGTKKLAMPKIACGIDGQDWNIISKMIQEVFEDTDMEILVRYIE